jgi:hypothetical protein
MEVKTTTRKFLVSEFYKLAEVGILSGDDRVELLDGADSLTFSDICLKIQFLMRM